MSEEQKSIKEELKTTGSQPAERLSGRKFEILTEIKNKLAIQDILQTFEMLQQDVNYLTEQTYSIPYRILKSVDHGDAFLFENDLFSNEVHDSIQSNIMKLKDKLNRLTVTDLVQQKILKNIENILDIMSASTNRHFNLIRKL